MHYNQGMKQKQKQKPETAMQVRVPSDVFDLFRRAAERDHRTLSGWVRDRLQKVASAELDGKRA